MTISNDQIIKLIADIYATVDAPDRWPEVVKEIAARAGAPKSLLFTPHHGFSDGGLWFGHNFGMEELESYIDLITGGYLTRWKKGDRPSPWDTPWFGRWPGVRKAWFKHAK